MGTERRIAAVRASKTLRRTKGLRTTSTTSRTGSGAAKRRTFRSSSLTDSSGTKVMPLPLLTMRFSVSILPVL